MNKNNNKKNITKNTSTKNSAIKENFNFELFKKNVLTKIDKSKKGYIDEKIKNLCNTINQHENFVTLSSCSGRILLLKVPKNKKKHLSEWLIVTHEKAKTKEFYKTIKEYEEKIKNTKEKEEYDIYFKMEAAILHVACKKESEAFKLIELAKQNGFRRVGVISKRKNTVELICNENISLPIYDYKNKKFIINEEQLEFLIKKSNEKLQISWKAINSLEEKFKKTF